MRFISLFLFYSFQHRSCRNLQKVVVLQKVLFFLIIQLGFIFFAHLQIRTKNSAAADGVRTEFTPYMIHRLIQFFLPFFFFVREKRLLHIIRHGSIRLGRFPAGGSGVCPPKAGRTAFWTREIFHL